MCVGWALPTFRLLSFQQIRAKERSVTEARAALQEVTNRFQQIRSKERSVTL